MSFSMVYDTLQVAKEHLLLVAIIGVFLLHLLRLLAPPTIKNVPTVRYSNWLPDFVNRTLYYPYAISMIEAGYYKVCSKSPWLHGSMATDTLFSTRTACFE